MENVIDVNNIIDTEDKNELHVPELPPIEETWDNIKQQFLNLANVACTLSTRVDNMVNIREAAYAFFDWTYGKSVSGSRMTMIRDWTKLSQLTYIKIRDIVASFEMEEFLKEEMVDYFEELIPTIGPDDNEVALFEAKLVFDMVKPFGERMNAVHQTMLNESKAREANQ